MTIRVTTDVFCDLCPKWFHGLVSYKKEARLARELAKDAGWTLSRREGQLIDICPKCTEERESE